MLPEIDIQYIAIATVFAFMFAAREQAITGRLRKQLDQLAHERVDPNTSLLSQTAIPLRLEPELAWAELENQQMGVAVFQVHGGRAEHAARALRIAMRGEENAYLLGPNRFLAGLWNTTEEGAAIAIDRLGSAISDAGHDVIDVGLAMFPDDGRDLEELIELAWNGRVPLDQQPPPRSSEAPPRRLVGPASRLFSCLRAMAPGLAAALLIIVGAHMMYPLVLDGAAAGTASIVASLALAAAFSLAVALAIRWVWNFGSPGEPMPSAMPAIGRRATALIGACTFGALAAPVVVNQSGIPVTLLALCLYAALLVVPLLHARFLIRVDTVPLIVMALVCAGLLFITFEHQPLIANMLRLIGAMAIGCVLSRNMERVTWVLLVALSISAIDIWSVYSAAGTTHKLATASANSSQGRLLEMLLLTGPKVDGRVVFELGTTDLVFTVVFLSFAHFWRLDLARNTVALVLAMVVAILASTQSPAGLPVLPFLAAAFLLVNARVLLRDLAEVLGRSGTESAEPAVRERRSVTAGG